MRHSAMLRARIAASAGDLARTEEEMARVHDELAVRRAGHSAEYQRIADEARRAARRAHDIERRYSD